MSAETTIEWATHTFNPWEGCTKVSPGCANCYAEARNHRFGNDNWGRGHPRRRTSKANWFGPRRWNNEDPHTEQYRPRIFCASLADWLDAEVPFEWLADLLRLIHETPNCDWLLLTKRPGNFSARLNGALEHLTGDAWDRMAAWSDGEECPDNVWVGVSVEDQQRADERLPELLKIPSRVSFLSVEPLLGPVDLRGISSRGRPTHGSKPGPIQVDWVILGGESGKGARSCQIDWIRELLKQCRAAGVPTFVKQLGSRPIFQTWPAGDVLINFGERRGLKLKHKKGGDPAEWPEDLRVREFPKLERSS